MELYLTFSFCFCSCFLSYANFVFYNFHNSYLLMFLGAFDCFKRDQCRLLQHVYANSYDARFKDLILAIQLEVPITDRLLIKVWTKKMTFADYISICKLVTNFSVTSTVMVIQVF